MEPINTALLSFGMSGRVFHAPFLATNEEFIFHSVLERTKNEAQKLFPSVKTFRSLKDLLADEEVELVIVNTPNTTHFEYAKLSLMAGKHVVVEKPFTVTVAEGAELIALAKQNNKVLTVYHNRRYDSDYKTVKQVLQNGWLGNIVEAEFHFDRYKKELSPKQHKETPGGGTGGLYDLGSHIIDQGLQLFGKPDALFADIRMIRPHSQVDDYFEILFYYPNKRVRLRSSYLVREALPGYVIHGELGSFIKHKTNIQEDALQNGRMPDEKNWGEEELPEHGLLHTEIDNKVVRKVIPSLNGNYNNFYNELYASIREGKEAPVLAEEALDVIRIIEAAFKSNEEKKVVDLKW
jgi:predicted dehydrogenase